MLFESAMIRIKQKIFLIQIGSLLLILFSCSNHNSNAQTKTDDKKLDIKPFTASILNSFYAEAYSVQTILTEKDLKIVFKSDLEGEKDTTVFVKSLPDDCLLFYCTTPLS